MYRERLCFLCSENRKEVIKIAQSTLMKIEYLDLKSETRLEAYADTVVLEQEGKTNYIAAIRFGGHPESVKGLCEAIYGGGTVTLEINSALLTAYSRVKQYRKELSHDGIYAEATLLIQDEEQSSDDNASDNNSPRKCYLFCEHNNHDRLFEELEKNGCTADTRI